MYKSSTIKLQKVGMPPKNDTPVRNTLFFVWLARKNNDIIFFRPLNLS